ASARRLLDGAQPEPELGQQPVLHLLCAMRLPRRPIHRLGPGGGGHGACRPSEARRAGEQSGPHRQDAGGRRRRLMRVDAFDFELPDHLIALEPARPRDQARLLVVRPGSAVGLEDSRVAALPNLLEPGDTLVLNDTKVIPARLTGRRINRGERPSIEVLLSRRIAPARWLAFSRPGKRLEARDPIRFREQARVCLLGELDATVAAKGDRGEVELAFNLTGAVLDEAVEQLGEVPLPPFIGSRGPAGGTD